MIASVFASIILFVIYSFVLVPEEVDAQACASNGQCRDTVGGPCISAPAGKFSNARLTCDLCGPGRFSSTTGSMNTCSTQCAAGRYWSNTTALMTTSDCAGFTSPGAFSAQGSLISTTPDGDGLCPVGKFSVSGGACTICPPGYASTVVGTGPDCFAFPCPLGTFYQVSGSSGTCVNTASITQGRYGIQVGAPDSTQYVSTYSLPCPAGRFATTGQSSDSCQGPCSEGYFCAAGSISSTPATGACPVGKANPLQGMTSINDCVDCEAGFFCSSTASISLRGATLSRPTQVLSCSQGRFGARGQSASTCSGSCYPGYWCPEGSVAVNTTFPADYSLALSQGRGMFPCGSVSRFCPAGTSAANGSAVPAGNLGIPIPGGDSTLQFAISTAECPANIGTVCLGGVKVVCQPGQWRNGAENNCRTCEPGFRCPTANSTVRFSCGSFNNTISQLFNKWYCPSGSIEPLLVTPGYFTWRNDGSNPPHINREFHTDQTICDRMGICVDGIYTGIIRFPGQLGNSPQGMQNRQLCTVPNMAGGFYDSGQTVMVQEAMTSPQSNQKILASASIPSSLTVSQTVVSLSGWSSPIGELRSLTWAYPERTNDPECQPISFSKNQNIFAWDQSEMEIIQTRYNEPDYLNFEVCAPYTNGDLVRYQAIVTFTADGIYPSYPGSPYAGESITLNINCTGLIQVLDIVELSSSSTPTDAPTTSNPVSSQSPTNHPTTLPTLNPTTKNPTKSPTVSPTSEAIETTSNPTISPSTNAPTTSNPTLSQSPTNHPTTLPTLNPTTKSPTKSPTVSPTSEAIETTSNPTISPTTNAPTTSNPTLSQSPTFNPTTKSPTESPTSEAIETTSNPTTNVPTTSNSTLSQSPTTTKPSTNSPIFSEVSVDECKKIPTQAACERSNGQPTKFCTLSQLSCGWNINKIQISGQYQIRFLNLGNFTTLTRNANSSSVNVFLKFKVRQFLSFILDDEDLPQVQDSQLSVESLSLRLVDPSACGIRSLASNDPNVLQLQVVFNNIQVNSNLAQTIESILSNTTGIKSDVSEFWDQTFSNSSEVQVTSVCFKPLNSLFAKELGACSCGRSVPTQTNNAAALNSINLFFLYAVCIFTYSIL